MRKRQRWLAPYLADSYLVEGVAILVGLLGFVLAVIFKAVSNTSDVGIALSVIIGLLTTLVAQLFIDRAAGRSRRSRLERVEAALADRNIFEYMAKVCDAYAAATNNMRLSPHHRALYEEVTRNLLSGNDWENISQRRLEIRDPLRELTIAKELLPTAVHIRAIAVPSDLDYLESPGGQDYLDEQVSRIQKKVLTVQRLFVYSSRAAHQQNLDLVALQERIQAVGRVHGSKDIECRLLLLDPVPGVDEVPDVNLYDKHSVRFSTLQVGEGQMQAIISESDVDLRRYQQLFGSLWSMATPIPTLNGANPPVADDV